MGGRPELKKGARGEEMLLVLVGCFLLLQQEVLGGGISVVFVGMEVIVGFSLSVEAYDLALESFFLLNSVVLVAGGRESKAQQHGPRALSHWHPVLSVVVSDDSVKASSQVMKILISTSMPEARSCAEALDTSSENQEVQELFLTTQTNSRRCTGSRWDEARWAMSRSWGRINVTPVEPAMRRTVSKAAKSACDEPYGPSIKAVYVCWDAMASC